jgi:uncharacterized membrane protein
VDVTLPKAPYILFEGCSPAVSPTLRSVQYLETFECHSAWKPVSAKSSGRLGYPAWAFWLVTVLCIAGAAILIWRIPALPADLQQTAKYAVVGFAVVFAVNVVLFIGKLFVGILVLILEFILIFVGVYWMRYWFGMENAARMERFVDQSKYRLRSLLKSSSEGEGERREDRVVVETELGAVPDGDDPPIYD